MPAWLEPVPPAPSTQRPVRHAPPTRPSAACALLPPAPKRLPCACRLLRASLVPCAHPSPVLPPARPAPEYPAQRPTALCSMGSILFQVLHAFFFHFFHPLENTKKNIYLVSIIFQYTNKFIKIYFIYIIIIFHFPTNQINWLNLFYLFSCSSLHIVNSKVCLPTCLCAIYLSTQTFTSHIQHVIHTKHIHTTIHQSTLSHTKHTCRVLVLLCAFPR